MKKNIYTHRTETIEASNYIHANIATCYLGTRGNTSYYNVNGEVWGIWQSGTGNYPETLGAKAASFK